ncbi:uncharacterized protein LOC121642815 isoform X2 [Melanotaenia boesemani]|uniref:uncharacterized protein LOC121642815 isoform X2 n=1 Tax=Melanotaenia boesemani TaxID=1250792 RepID=UPI001C050BA9|nr:uncharacterized protein LOC121642815 isoform X2 [Melanotaenia boesemani]
MIIIRRRRRRRDILCTRIRLGRRIFVQKRGRIQFQIRKPRQTRRNNTGIIPISSSKIWRKKISISVYLLLIRLPTLRIHLQYGNESRFRQFLTAQCAGKELPCCTLEFIKSTLPTPINLAGTKSGATLGEDGGAKQRHLTPKTQEVKEKLDKIMKGNKEAAFTDITKATPNFNTRSLNGVTCEHNQFARFYLLMKNCTWVISNQYKPNHANSLHSEEILLNDLNTFLQDEGDEVSALFIYTFNSPCLHRYNKTPCMFLLLDQSPIFKHFYGFQRHIFYTKNYGIAGPHYYKNIKYSDISHSGSPFQKFCKDQEKVAFNIKSNFQNLIKEFFENNHEKNLYKDKLKSALNCHRTRQEHLDQGHEIFGLSDYNAKWTKIVEKEFMQHVREKLRSAVVPYFAKTFLGNSCPKQLYQLGSDQSFYPRVNLPFLWRTLIF